MLLVCQGAEVWEALGEWVTEAKPHFGPGTKERFEMASMLPANEVLTRTSPHHRIAVCSHCMRGKEYVMPYPQECERHVHCAVQIAEANDLRERVRKHVDALLGGNAVLLVPSAAGPAPKLATPQEQLNSYRMRLISLTSIAGLCGLPQVSCL